MRPSRDLSGLFNPRSVTVVGASNDPAKWGHALARHALRSVDRRPVYLVNHRGEDVLNQPTFSTVADVEGDIDLVVVAVPAAALEAVVDESLDRGARGIVVVTAGVGETGEAGRALEASLAQRVRAAGAAMVGPNCMGLVDTFTDVHLASDPFEAGSVALLSQSGNVALELSARFAEHRLGMSRFVSLGNQADVDLVDLITDCVAHEATKAIAIYVEDFQDGRAFVAAAHAAHLAGVPIVALAPGASSGAIRSAASHTGALTSPAQIVQTACASAGVTVVHTPREMVTALAAFTGSPRAAGSRIAILTDGGGHGTIAADVADTRGLEVNELAGATRLGLSEALWDAAGTANPIDLAGFGEQDPLGYARALDVLLADDDVDAVLFTGYFGGYSSDPHTAEWLRTSEIAAARAIGASVTASSKPVLTHSMFPTSPSAQTLRDGGATVYDSLEDAVDGLALLRPSVVPATGDPVVPQPLPALDRDDYVGSIAAVRAAGVAVTDAVEVGPDGIDSIPFAGPYALKAVGLLHKSDEGGVRLGLADAEAVRSELADMHARLGASSYMIERMADLRDGVELIVGINRDPRFGPVLLVGLGGVLTEVLADTAMALAPVTAEQAAQLLDRLRGAPLLHGVRGRPAVNIEAAAAAIEALSALAAAHPEWAEFEVNPLVVTPGGAIALDARIVTA